MKISDLLLYFIIGIIAIISILGISIHIYECIKQQNYEYLIATGIVAFIIGIFMLGLYLKSIGL